MEAQSGHIPFEGSGKNSLLTSDGLSPIKKRKDSSHLCTAVTCGQEALIAVSGGH